MQEKHVTTSGWELWLAKWNRELLDRIDPALDNYSPLFRVDGFIYASSICGKLKGGKDPLSSYLVSQFGSATRQLLEQYTPPDPPDSELTTDWVMDASGRYVPPNQPGPMLLKALVDELNRLLQGPLLYEEERFKGVQLSKKAISFIEKNPSGESLVRLNRMLIDAAYPYATGRNHDHIVETDISPEVIASGWLGYPGATEDQITGLEARLGQALPPSYRAFLKVSNGFRQPGLRIGRLLSTDEVEWFRGGHQHMIDILKEVEIDLSNAVEISVQDIDGLAVYLLNPNVVTANGEWEALSFDCKGDYAPHPSFRDLMKNEYRYSVLWAPRGAGKLRPEDDPQMIVVKFPNLVKDLERKMQSIADDQDLSTPVWSDNVLKVLKATESRLIKIREKSSQPEVIRQQLSALEVELEEKFQARVKAQREAGLYFKDGLEDGYIIARASITWFL